MNLCSASLIDKVHKYNTQFLLGIPDCNTYLEVLYNDALDCKFFFFFFFFWCFTKLSGKYFKYGGVSYFF